MSTRIKRVPVPFLFDARDCRGANGALIARSYGKELTGVFTRAGAKRGWDSNGVGMVFPHSLPALHPMTGEAALHLGSAATNVCLQSENFGTTWVAFNTPTRTAAAVTVAGIVLDLIADVGPSPAGYYQIVSFTGDGTKVVSIHLKAGTAATTYVDIADNTAGFVRHRVTVTWTGGVPSVATESGSGTVFAVEEVFAGSGVYRIAFSVASVVAANENRVRVFPSTLTSATGSVNAGGVQAENASTPGPYVKTTTVAASVVADALYFPWLSSAAELQARGLTLYGRLRLRRVGAINSVLVLGEDGIGDANCLGLYVSATGVAATIASTASGQKTSSRTVTLAVGDLLEYLTTVTSGAAPVVQVTSSVNGENPVVSTASAAGTWPTAFPLQRLYFADGVTAARMGDSGRSSVVADFGVRTMAEMRALAGVG
jgi:hypothetical protein